MDEVFVNIFGNVIILILMITRKTDK